MKNYRLFYRDVEIGEITQEDADFPNLLGTFRPSASMDGGELRDRLGRYVAYCVAADQAMMEGGEEAWERYVQENESEFVDLIETEDWYVLEGEQKEPVLVPIFYQGGAVVWRWNFLDAGRSGTAAA